MPDKNLKLISFQPLSSEENFDDLNSLFQATSSITNHDNVVIDMSGANFLVPSRAINLVLACRYISSVTGTKILIRNLPQEMQKYMLRMDIPFRAQEWLEIENLGNDDWARNPHSSQLLELKKISSPTDVELIIERASIILGNWLNESSLNSLISTLSELCSNVYQHSEDLSGIALIQKYEKTSLNIVNIQVAVGDLGQGIRGSLEMRHGILANTTIEYLKLAMDGKSARNTGRGGLGLRRVEQILNENLGYLFLRSHNASVYSHHKAGRLFNPEMCFFPGTQIALGLNFPINKIL